MQRMKDAKLVKEDSPRRLCGELDALFTLVVSMFPCKLKLTRIEEYAVRLRKKQLLH